MALARGLRRLQRRGGDGPGNGEHDGGGGDADVDDGAGAGHDDLLQQQVHPLPEVALAEEGRSRERTRTGADPGHFDERREVRLTTAKAADHRSVHGLLAGETDAADEPVDGGMEEEDGLQQLLEDQRTASRRAARGRARVCAIGTLALAIHRLEGGGQQDGGPPQPERGRRPVSSEQEEARPRRELVAQGHAATAARPRRGRAVAASESGRARADPRRAAREGPAATGRRPAQARPVSPPRRARQRSPPTGRSREA